MKHKQQKLENPNRVQELNPSDTLVRIGLKADSAVADIGAGTGILALAAARICRGSIYALETDAKMLQLIEARASAEGLTNVNCVKVEDKRLPLADDTVDIVLMVTVLHELSDPLAMLQEASRIMKEQARLAVVEFLDSAKMGPPPGVRLAREAVYKMLETSDFVVVDDFDLGENMYCLVAQTKPPNSE